VTVQGKTKLMLVTPTMGIGGTEHCVANLMRYLDRKRFDIDLVMVFDRETFWPIPPDVWTHVLEHDQPPVVPYNVLKRCPRIPKELARSRADLSWLELTGLKLARIVRQRQPEVVFSAHMYSSILCSLSRKHWSDKVRLVVSADNHASTMFSRTSQGPLFSFLLSSEFPQAQAIVVPSHGVAADLADNFGIPPSVVTVIPYPIDLQNIDGLARRSADHCWYSEQIPIIISVGRLVPQKGFDHLLRAFSLLRKQGANVRLVLLGDGDERQRLESLAAELGVRQHIWFAGKQANPFKYVASSTLFVLSSLFEGLPNVLCEALACGCPVISTDCHSGPAEILQDKYGILVPPGDEEALAAAMHRLLKDQELRARLRQLGLQRAKDFEASRIVRLYEHLVLDVSR
jgi:glycosyltransferase involved in cell wall biosynthesis